MRSELIDKVRDLIEKGGDRTIFIVIDGPAGAGKSTLAQQIIEGVGAGTIIHGDDLYNGWTDALTPTLERNIHRWIITPLKEGRMPRYQRYDWHAGGYLPEQEIPSSPLVVLEGVGVALKSVTDHADLSMWMDIPAERGLERVLARDGVGIQEEMVQWIRIQQAYFEEHHNRENCAVHLPYGAPAQP